MDTRRTLSVVGVGLLAALIGFTLLETGKHLWLDHKALHEMIGVINYNLQTGGLRLPAPPPPAPAPNRSEVPPPGK